MVDQAFFALPQLHAALRGEGGITSDLEGMQAFADRIANGEEVLYVAPAADVAEVAEEAAVASMEVPEVEPAVEAAASEPASPEDTVAASVDPVLLEILEVEVGGHLGTVDQWIATAPALADDALMRAIHTMNGAFAMTDVPSITDAMTPAEAYVKRLLAARAVASADGIAALAELADAARTTVAALNHPSPRVPRFTALAARLVELRDSLPDAKMSFEEPELEIAEVEYASDSEPSADDLAAIDLSAFSDLTGLPADVVVGRSAAAADIENAEADRLEAERVEAELLEADRLEAERVEAERLEAERLEAERLEAERLEAERIETERLETERLEAERLEAERLKAEEDAEYARLEAEYAEQDRIAREQKLNAERSESERAEAERLEAERAEAERAEAERLEAERAEAERLEAERLETERAEA
jgi:chemosensory pili system protein ChpA (sensor histidine kinase/response regulator)